MAPGIPSFRASTAGRAGSAVCRRRWRADTTRTRPRTAGGGCWPSSTSTCAERRHGGHRLRLFLVRLGGQSSVTHAVVADAMTAIESEVAFADRAQVQEDAR